MIASNAANLGKTIANFADNSVDIMTRYQFTPRFAMGAALEARDLYPGLREGLRLIARDEQRELAFRDARPRG